MKQFILYLALVIRDYDEAITFYTEKLHYGMVAVFEDMYGNLWDLLQGNEKHPLFRR